MVDESSTLQQRLTSRFEDRVAVATGIRGQVTIEVAAEQLAEVARVLRDEPEFGFEQLVDVCGIDYLGFGQDEWETEDVTSEGFSRGVEGSGPGRFRWADRPAVVDGEKRFAAIIHLLSIRNNHRLRIRCFCPDDSLPMVPSLTAIWPVANWFEREAFDLFGIVFEGHPDLRRILTDYGFVGHPFRKDFPLIGNVEVLYDAERGRVVYQPVTIEPRVTVPRVVRHDSRFQQAASEQALAEQAIAPQGK